MKNNLTNEEVIKELENTKMDELVEQFILNRTYDNFVSLAHKINQDGIITCCQLIFNDENLENELKETGYLDPCVIYDQDKTSLNQLLVEINDEKWFPIFTDKAHIKESVFMQNNCIIKTTFKQVYEDFTNAKIPLKGIVINPYTDQICLVNELCYFVASDCDESLLDDDDDETMKN